MRDIVHACNTFCNTKYQSNYYQFLCKHFSHRFIHDELGCRASETLHTTARRHIATNGGVALFKPNFGRPATSNIVHQRIKQFLIQNSPVSPSQTTTKDPDNPNLATSKRILEDSISNLWIHYRLAAAIHTESESTFRKCCKKCKTFSRANHNTDMCGYCLEAVNLKADMKRLSDLFEEHQLLRIMNVDLDEGDEYKMDEDSVCMS